MADYFSIRRIDYSKTLYFILFGMSRGFLIFYMMLFSSKLWVLCVNCPFEVINSPLWAVGSFGLFSIKSTRRLSF